jgi:PAS domain S-box-containing protein/diguanylate cyclase (GGDEF)-like protein
MMPENNSPNAVVQQALQDGELHKKLLDELDTGIYIVDQDRRILYWNTGAERITGYMAHEVAGEFCHGDLLVHCDDEGSVLCGTRCPLTGVMLDGKPRECAVFLRHRRGHRLPVRVRSSPIHDQEGNIVGAVEVFDERSTPGRHAIWQLQNFGCLDELTTAANRRYGEMRVLQAIQGLTEFGIPFGWLRIALDGAEQLEHRYGQGMIDAALKTVAATLDGNLGALDVLTRWSRTEFRVEVHYSSRFELADMAEKLVALIRLSTLDWWGDRVRVTISIGGATAAPGDTLETVEARVAAVLEGCQAGGGNRAAVCRAREERKQCSR